MLQEHLKKHMLVVIRHIFVPLASDVRWRPCLEDNQQKSPKSCVLWTLDIAIVASNGWMYKLEHRSRNWHGHVTHNKVQESYCHHTSIVAMMVVRLPTPQDGKKLPMDSNSHCI